MGTLLDTKFWAGTLNQLAELQPARGQAISKPNAAKIRQIACTAFSKLTADPDFSADLAKAIDLTQKAFPVDAKKTPNFKAFLDSFMLLENKILADAGVNSVASRDLDREVRGLATESDASGLDRLEDKINFLKRLACDPKAADDPKRPLWVAVWRGIKGVSVIGIDAGTAAGSAVVLGPAGAAATGTVAGFSIGYGAALVNDAVKGRW